MKIRDLLLANVKGLYGEKACGDEFDTKVVKVCDLKNNGDIDYENLESRNITSKNINDAYLKKGDILIAKSGNPKCCYCDKNTNIVACNFIYVLRVKSSIIQPKLLFYILKFLFEEGKFDSCFSKVTIQNLILNLFLETDIEILDMSIQQNFLKILESLSLDINKCESTKKLLNELIFSVFDNLFGDPSINSKNFNKLRIGEIGSLKNGMNFRIEDSGFELSCLGVGDFKNNDFLTSTNCLSNININKLPQEDYFLKKNDIVFVRSNGNKSLVGRSILIKNDYENLTFSGFCIRFRNESTLLNPYYLIYYFKHPNIRKLMAGRGANIQNLNQQILSNLIIPVPPAVLQDSFEKVVANVTKSIDEVEHLQCNVTYLIEKTIYKYLKYEE